MNIPPPPPELCAAPDSNGDRCAFLKQHLGKHTWEIGK